jgi:hypothetical protein
MGLVNGVPLINGVAYSWGDIVTTIAGVPVMGITAVEYGDEQVVENHYGAGRHPVSRSKGRITASAKITLTMEEVVAIQQQAVNGRLQDIPPFDVQVSYIPTSGVIVHDKVRNCQFKANKRSWKEGDSKQEVELELVPSHIEWSGLI